MNIFVMEPNPPYYTQFPSAANVMWLDDKRLNKMIVETAQMLSTVFGPMKDPSLYKPTHRNHPCTVWARDTVCNAEWLAMLGTMMLNERHKRGFTKEHKTAPVIRTIHDWINRAVSEPSASIVTSCFSSVQRIMTPFVNCTTHHKHIDDVYEAYRLEMALKWRTDKREPRWTNRPIPYFYDPQSYIGDTVI